MEIIDTEEEWKKETKYELLSRVADHLREELSQNEMEKLYRFGERNRINGPRNCVGAEIATMVASRMLYETERYFQIEDVENLLQLLSKKDVAPYTVVTPKVVTDSDELQVVNSDGERLLVSDDRSTAHIASINSLALCDEFNMKNALEVNVFAPSVLCGKQMRNHSLFQAHYQRSELNQSLSGTVNFAGVSPRQMCQECAAGVRSERDLGFDELATY